MMYIRHALGWRSGDGEETYYREVELVVMDKQWIGFDDIIM